MSPGLLDLLIFSREAGNPVFGAVVRRSMVHVLCGMPVKDKANYCGDLPGSPVVMTSSTSAGSVGLIPGWRAKISHASWPKKSKYKNLATLFRWC